MRKSNFWEFFSVTILASFVFLRCTETGDSSLDKADDVEADSGVKSDLSPVLPFDVNITGDKLENAYPHVSPRQFHFCVTAATNTLSNRLIKYLLFNLNT